jgi:hypothetical protein
MAALAPVCQQFVLSDPPGTLGLPTLGLRGQVDREGALGVKKV